LVVEKETTTIAVKELDEDIARTELEIAQQEQAYELAMEDLRRRAR